MRSGKEALGSVPCLRAMNPLGSRRSQRNLWGSRLTASPRSFLVGELVVQGCSFSFSASLRQSAPAMPGQEGKDCFSPQDPAAPPCLPHALPRTSGSSLATTSYLFLICKYFSKGDTFLDLHLQSAFLTQSVSKGRRLNRKGELSVHPISHPKITTIPRPFAPPTLPQDPTPRPTSCS